jgi:hypothetical protein
VDILHLGAGRQPGYFRYELSREFPDQPDEKPGGGEDARLAAGSLSGFKQKQDFRY